MNLISAIIILIIVFYVLAVLTEEYFIPAIDIVSQKLNLSSDASGATLLAMGSSAPEFFTALIAVLGLAGSGNGDIGTGTIVGSAIFNMLVIVGVAAIFRTIKLNWKVVIRDQLFYGLTIILLLFAFWDGHITLIESIIFMATYGIYVFLVINWKKWLKYEDEGLNESVEVKKHSMLKKTTHQAIGLVVPRPHKHPRLYVVSLVLSVLGIGLLSWLLVRQVIVISEVLNINSTFLALTVVAAGTSVPDMISSVIVAKQGRGDMAVSNAVGSNIFNILFGLSFPWMLAILISKEQVAVSPEDLLSSIYLLAGTIVLTLTLLVFKKWEISKRSGIFFIAVYLTYCAYIIFTIA
jgi:K+-dependent Na+/Ca+ exchanger-like protein